MTVPQRATAREIEKSSATLAEWMTCASMPPSHTRGGRSYGAGGGGCGDAIVKMKVDGLLCKFDFVENGFVLFEVRAQHLL
jgi:hypothetical protein